MSANSKSDTETSGRCLGQSPDTCHVPIATSTWEFPQTVWLNAGTHNQAAMTGLEEGPWYHSYKESAAVFGGFLKEHACPKFLKALREELGDG